MMSFLKQNGKDNPRVSKKKPPEYLDYLTNATQIVDIF